MLETKKYFNHFKLHTQYSICEGAIKIEDLEKYCKTNKIKSLGISDTSNLCGALQFSETVSKSKTQPIIGSQIKFKHKDLIGLIPFIATNDTGYKNIVKLSSNSYLNHKDFNEPFCEFKDLKKYKDGLIITLGSLNSLVGDLFKKDRLDDIKEIYIFLKDLLKNNFYIEIQRHNDFNEKNLEIYNLNLSCELNIPIIASHEVYYLEKNLHEAHDALMCIGSKSYINDKNRLKLSNNHYLKNDDEMYKLFSDIPEALENNFNLALRCNYRPTTSKPLLPNIGSKETFTADDILKKEAEKGLKERISKNLNRNSESKLNDYHKRLNHEINIICKMNYASYFLIVSDYIKWAKENNIPVGPGRGSGAGSLVAWCLSITDVDPIKFDLIFERFLNPDRVSMPDFDIDFCEDKRDLVFEYLNNKYPGSVAHIVTFGKLKARMVIRDVGRVMGLPYGFVDSICKMIPFDPSRPMNLNQCINLEPKLQKLIKEDKRVERLINLSLKLEGLNRNFATHAAGVVIADKNLSETVPLYKDPSSNLLLPSTQFDMYSAENAGLIKFDFLGLKTLTVINKTQDLIKKKVKEFDIKNIKYNDEKVYDLLSSGKTIGLFQLESSGMREALMQMKPNQLEDIIALVALYRPGPMSNISIYNDCKHGKKEPDYLHPKLEKILKPTYGVIIYQEQVMQIAQVLSGFSAGEADLLRRAMGKKKRAELERQKSRFVEGAFKNGISKDIAAGIFLKIEPFAEYGFNKSHAAAYAIIAYQTAYLKTHFSDEFFAASMSMELSNQKKLSEFCEEIKRLDIKIIRPDINKCFADFYSENNNFYYALGAIKNVGFESISNIVTEREKNGKFKSISDFLNRVNSKDINKLQLEGLAKAGAFDSIFNNRSAFYSSIPNIILKSKNIFENKSKNQIELFSSKENFDNQQIVKDEPEWKFQDKMSKEFETIGFYLSDHPLNQYKDIFNEYNITKYSDFINDKNQSESMVASTILKIQEKKTQKGTSYAIIKFSDLGGVFLNYLFFLIFLS
ncbi:MAG: DNA polymerase III subunit alpha [Candidatus Pelagibacter sp.]